MGEAAEWGVNILLRRPVFVCAHVCGSPSTQDKQKKICVYYHASNERDNVLAPITT